MDKKKPGSYQCLYEIETLLKIVEEKDERSGSLAKFVMVKWKNFPQPTKEPYESIKMVQLCETDLQKLEEEFDQRKCTNLVNFQEKTREYFEQYRSKLYPSDCKPDHRERAPSKQKRKLTIEQKVRCKLAARQKIKHRIEYGLRGLSARDYLYFVKAYYQAQEHLEGLIQTRQLPKTDTAAEAIKGVFKKDGAYRYCVQVSSKVFSCSLEETKQYFPARLTTFLHNFTEYMKKYMKEEIEELERHIKKRNYKERAFKKVEHILKLKEKYQSNSTPVFFGLDQEDALRNRKKQNDRRRQIEEFLKYERTEAENNEAEPPQESVVEGIFLDLLAEMNEMSLRSTAKALQNDIQIKKTAKTNQGRLGSSSSNQKNSSNSRSRSSKRQQSAGNSSKKVKNAQKQKVEAKKSSIMQQNSTTSINKSKTPPSGSGSKDPSNQHPSKQSSKPSRPISSNSDRELINPNSNRQLRSSTRLSPKPKVNYSGSEDAERQSSDSGKSKKPTKKRKNE